MTRAKGGLGRGLAALIPTGPPTTAVSDVLLRTLDGSPGQAAYVSRETTSPPRYAELALADIVPNRRNPRAAFDEESLDELAHSIREFGVLQPVVVRPLAATGYELVMGERRWRAARQAGLDRIPALVRRTEDADMLRDALLENVQRADLNPLEEAAAYQQLLEEFEVTHEELAARLGRSRPVISNTIRLLKLPVAVQRRVASGVLTAGHARALLALDDAGQQEDLAARIVAEGLSVRGTEEAATLLASAPARSTRIRPRGRATAVELTVLAERLSDLLDTSVRAEMGRTKGKLTVAFASLDDLDRILDQANPALRERLGWWREPSAR